MSGLIPRSFISGLLEKIDIIDVISDRVPLKKKGQNFSACCPFHNEKTPSFSVSHTKQFYHCFGCGMSGDAITFLMEFDRLSFIEAIEQLAKSIGLEVPYEKGNRPPEIQHKQNVYDLMEKISLYYQQQLFKHSNVLSYLHKRGLSDEAIKHFQIGYALDEWRQIEKIFGNTELNRSLLIQAGMLIQNDKNQPYDRFRNRIMFPIRNKQGQIIGFGGRSLENENPKYLNSPETPFFHKGQELYGLYEAQKAIRSTRTIIIVEGYMDAIALMQFGFPNTAATLGTAATPEHIKTLLRYAEQLIFCFDGDTAGRNAAWRALENALPLAHENSDIKFAFLPEGEDPDSFLHKKGKEAFSLLVNSGLSLSEFFFQQLTDKLPLGTIEGKKMLCQRAKPLLQKLVPGIFQHLLVKQLAKIVNMNDAELSQIMGISLIKEQQKNKTFAVSNDYSISPIRMAITLLLQCPKLAEEVFDLSFLKNLQIPGSELFLDLLEFNRSHPHINTAALLQAYAEHPQINALKKLAQRELFYSENGLKQEFIDIMNRLQQQTRESEIEQLLTKANIEGLTSEERKILQQLILERHK